MQNADQGYIRLVDEILSKGTRKENRTGIDTISVFGACIKHDMSKGFPLLTTKKVFYKAVKVELEGFIKGITSKKWYQDRGCNIWNEWANPQKVNAKLDPFLSKSKGLKGIHKDIDEQRKALQLKEDDLGPIYGAQWRNFRDPCSAIFEENLVDWECGADVGSDKDGMVAIGKTCDQLKEVVDKLKTSPNDRRMIVSAWNPLAIHQMALPPCHCFFQLNVSDGKLDLIWYQRSVDVALGLPFNIASYATLLHLLAKESGLEEGVLTGMLGDTHVYENHVDAIREQCSRVPLGHPQIRTDKFTSIFDWEFGDTVIDGYKSHGKIKFDVAV